ncbi:hypothetical protein H310_06882 [Aphanomyces invadans]|uniref:Phospholipid-transporting ATPase n=1 Tax=Aphanomyces invadans TaxID=157072 RepID=A0A024U4Y7_9STRA|nr:hypothetical protein H310_06882 [Aphanomyces invadans]ETW01319.1 hypothetical protein H310_06882 [Aphanomyces invadans]|eukprot:XP_008870317.1 hypothetical protein H310_06882 [Aphanomyces invadans]
MQHSGALHSPPLKAQTRLVNQERTLPSKSNEIRTSYFMWWNFIPIFLFDTFRKMANVYFLVIGLLQTIPPISPTNGVPLQFLPLSIVVIIDGIFAAIEDYHRHRADHAINVTLCQQYNVSKRAFETLAWKDLEVGDLVQLNDNEVAPADLVVLAAEGQVAGCYVETKSLDGETNLKLRETLLQDMLSVPEPDIGNFLTGLRFEHDAPTPNIHDHRGTVLCSAPVVDVAVTLPIRVQHTVWRGCKIRNTTRIWGVVAYVGVDTKIMQGAQKRGGLKQSAIENVTEAQVLVLVAMLVVLCVIGASADVIWISPTLPSYLGPSAPPSPFITSFFYYLTTMAAIVPISLYVSITAVKHLQGCLMSWDLAMFDDGRKLPMQARNSSLNEQLGHITHIFSDKTGTLTCNKMEFRKCSIRGASYEVAQETSAAGRPSDSTHSTHDGCYEVERVQAPSNVDVEGRRLYADMDGGSGPDQAKAIHAFFTHLALSHCVMIDANHAFAASSPDDLALVRAAKLFGFVFAERTRGSILLHLPKGGRTEEYHVLAVFEFTSARKRMSVVVKANDADDYVHVLCKGADSMLRPRLRNDAWIDATQTQLQSFASEGLRTLVIASKQVALDTWTRFDSEYQQAQLHDPGLVERLQDAMEQDLTLLGATGIEDRLQEDVKEALHLLGKAGMAVWILTGDMEETAMNVAFGCSLLTNDVERFMINAKTCPTRVCVLRQLDELYRRIIASLQVHDIAVVIDGASLALLFHDADDVPSDLSTDALHFLRVALLCRTVIACRCSPTQKAQLVELTRRHCPDARTLAIGDGANDVPMLRAAHIGVGIAGEAWHAREGRQAANSSDFAIGQFRFLARLVLVHGRWNYNRIAPLILFTYYKNIVYCMSLFWYMLAPSAYSGTLVYAVFIQQGYNLFFTALPVIALAVLDQDVPAHVCMTIPQLYTITHRKLLNHARFWTWIAMGLVDSVVLLYMMTLSASLVDSTGATTTLLTLGDMGWTALCLYMNVRIMALVSTWNVLMVGSVAVSVAFLFGFQIAIDILGLQDPTWEAPFSWLLCFPPTWLIQFLVVAPLALAHVWAAALQRTFRPTVLDLAQLATHVEPTLDELKGIEYPHPKWILPHLHQLHDTVETDMEVACAEDMQQLGRHHGFAYAQPVKFLRRLMHRGSPVQAKPRPRWNTEFVQFVLATDAVVYENERYQPFVGFGHSFPGHLLPSDRGHWSDASGGVSTNQAIPTALLRVDTSGAQSDDDGWEYAMDFTQFPTTTCHRRLAFVRRRRWVLRAPRSFDSA